MSITGLEIPEIFPLKALKCTIGRARGNSLILADLSMSRNHCIIEKNRNNWTLKDTSANGICLNSSPVTKNVPVDLKNGDVIALTDKISYCFRINSKYDHPQLRLVKDQDEKVTLDDTVINLCDTSLQSEASAAKPAAPSNTESLTSSLDPMREELTCSICAEIFIKATVLNCMHTFCSYCIATWRKNSNICPICRAKITREPVTSLVIDNCCKQVCIGMPEEEQKKREDMTKEREAEMSSIKSTTKTPSQRGGRGRGRGRRQAGGGRQPTGSSRRHVVEIEISSSDSDIDDDDDDDFLLLQDALMDDFLDYDDPDEGYTGVPGRYYGGYGSCYICHLPGHWANGCPNR